MLSVQSVFVLLIGCYIYSSLSLDPNLHGSNIVSWIGILRVKSGRNRTDAVTSLILIKKHLAMGNANDVAKVKMNTLSKFTTAIFYMNREWQHYGVDDYVLHPEYLKDVKNTIALVYLKHNRRMVHWDVVRWPTTDRISDDVYSIGLTDIHRRLQQVTKRMERVPDAECDDFYKKEKLDYESLQPSHKFCYKVLDSWKKCIIDPGMALAAKNKKTWTLIGISTHGPGCSMPSRYIQFFLYIPWIKSHSRPGKTQENFRRSNFLYNQGLEEPYEDQDTFLLSLLNNQTIVMRPTMAYVKENVFGRCDKIDGNLMYREFGTIRAPAHTATGVYSLSIYDLFFPTITCVMVTVMCDKRSETTFWFDKGFHQEDLEDYVKTIPGPKRNMTKLPRILYIKDTYKKYRATRTTNLQFKFEFTDEAKMDLEFYGKNVSSPMKAPRIHFLSKQKQTSGHLPDGADFNAREGETQEDLDKNDPFFHFLR